MPPTLSSDRHWPQFLRPLFLWLLLVLGLYGYREHQLWLAKTKIDFSITLNGQVVVLDAAVRLDGQPVVADQNISLGSHTFSVGHMKAESFRTNFFAWYGRHDLGEIRLKRSLGTLGVQAVPPATTITITGPEFSATLNDSAGTNVTVPTDAYEIHAEYPHWSELKQVTVFDGISSPCVFSPQLGTLHLTCNHEGATYVLQNANGQTIEHGNLPATVDGLPSGDYVATVSYHRQQMQKSLTVLAAITNEVPLAFVLGAAHLESVPAGAEVRSFDGNYLGQTPLDVLDLPAPTAQFNLSLQGYEPVSVTVDIVADRTTTAHTNLLSLRFRQAVGEARQYLNAGNDDRALQAVTEALGFKPYDADSLAMQATATERLKASRQHAESEHQRAETDRLNLERLKRPRMVFDSLCGQNPDAALFAEHELKTSKPAKDVEAAIVKALQAAPMGYQITADGLQQPETYQVTANQTFSLGILGGTERVCLLVVGQTKDDETQILFKVLDFQIHHTLVNFQDEKQLVPMHPTRMQLNDIDQTFVQIGERTVTERIQSAIRSNP